MKKITNKLLRLTILLIVILVIFIVKHLLINSFTQKNNIFPLSSIKPEHINEITVQRKDYKVEIYKKSNKWFLKENNYEYDADSEKITYLIESLLKIRNDEIVSKNKKNHNTFGINDQKIDIKYNGNSSTIYIGNISGTRNYIRINEGNSILLAEGFDNIFDENNFKDLSVRTIENQDKLEAVSLEYDSTYIDIMKKGNEWLIDNIVADKNKVDYFISDIKNLKAINIIKLDSDENVQNEKFMIIKIKEGGREKILEFFHKNENESQLVINNGDKIYTIAVGYTESLKKERQSFFN